MAVPLRPYHLPSPTLEPNGSRNFFKKDRLRKTFFLYDYIAQKEEVTESTVFVANSLL